MNLFTKFFCICSGANLKVLSECPTEHSKYAGIGGTIFFTACLAALSGTFAIQTISPSIYLSIGFGLFWGTMIFNLDRYIVSSLRKRGSLGKELLYAFPRFLLAVLISFVITKPLEIALFRNQISYQIERDNDIRDKQNIYAKLGKYGSDTLRQQREQLEQKRTQLKEAMSNAPTTYNYTELSQKVEAARTVLHNLTQKNTALIEEKNTKIKDLWKVYAKAGDSSQPTTYTSLNATGTQIKNKLTQEIAALNREMAVKQKELKNWEDKAEVERNRFQELTQRELEEVEAALKGLDEEIQRASSLATAELKDGGYTNKNYGAGILAELEALENLKASSSTVWWASWFLVVMFVVLETAPLFTKLMSDRGLYDEILERYEYEVLVQEKLRIAEINKKYGVAPEPQMETAVIQQAATLQQNLLSLEQTSKATEEALAKIKNLEAAAQSTPASPILPEAPIVKPNTPKATAAKPAPKPLVQKPVENSPPVVEDLYENNAVDSAEPAEKLDARINYNFSVNTGYSFMLPSEAEEEQYEMVEENKANAASETQTMDSFVGKLWVNKDAEVQESYLFKLGKRKNKVIYNLGHEKWEGSWSYVNNHHLVKVELAGQSRSFQVTEITNTLLRLHETGPHGKSSYYISK